MFKRSLIDKFWAEVSKSVDARNDKIARTHEERAIEAFCNIILFSEDVDQGYMAGPVDLAFELASTTENNAGKVFDLEETLPPDIYKRGIGISKLAARAYNA